MLKDVEYHGILSFEKSGNPELSLKSAQFYVHFCVYSIDSKSGSIKGSGPGSPTCPQSPHSPASPMEMHAPYQRKTSLHAVQSAVSSALQSLVAGGKYKRKNSKLNVTRQPRCNV